MYLFILQGYEVHGIIRRSSSFNTGRINHLYKDPHAKGVRFFLHYGDLTDSSNLCGLMAKIQPDEIYNLGAQSHVKVSFDLSEYTAEVDGIGTLRLLNAIRTCGLEKKTRLYQASTSELYGKVQAIPQNEKTPFYPRSPYGVAKQFSYWMIINYREAYGMFLTNGILFNHESPRRGPTFVTRKITRAVARIKLGVQDCLYLGNLNSIRDWGHARDYVYGMWLMLQVKLFMRIDLQQDKPSDYVLSTGEGHTVREFCEKAFARVGIDVEYATHMYVLLYRWRGERGSAEEIGVDKANPDHVIVRVDPKYYRPTEVDLLIGDCTKAKTELGWERKVTFEKLVEEMVDSDLKSAEADLHFYRMGGDRLNEENEEFVVV